MKSFWKYVLATVLGLVLSLVIWFWLVIGFFSILMSGLGTEKTAVINEKSILKFDLSYDIPDKSSDNPFDSFDFMSFKVNKTLGLNDILKNIEKAKTDDNITGIYVELSGIDCGFSTLEEIRNKLIDFKTSGKFILAYSSFYTQKSYYLASVADEIYMHPQGSFDWKGLYSSVMFFKGALDKLGIEAQIFRHGQFKSAVEPYFTDKMSEASKLQTSSLITSVWNDICKKISSQRSISVEQLNLLADSLKIHDATTALANGFVDSIIYYDELLSILKSKSLNEADVDEKDLFVELSKYNNVTTKQQVNKSTNYVAVIFAEGEIVDGGRENGKIGGDWMAKIIREVREDDDVKAVVLRVNSPGGSGLASDVMWRELVLLREKKPLVVSMGNLAASGGYYISCPANFIFAQPNTITGSIGVFGMLPNVQKLMNEHLGLTVDGVGTNQNSSFGLLTRPVNEQERNLIQTQVEEFYKVFISKVAQDRHLTIAEVDSIGQGRVWSGLNALEIGLVDSIGGLNDAVNKAVVLANLTDHKIVEYPEKEDYMTIITEDMMNTIAKYIIKYQIGNDNYKIYKQLESIKGMKGVQARMEYIMQLD